MDINAKKPLYSDDKTDDDLDCLAATDPIGVAWNLAEDIRCQRERIGQLEKDKTSLAEALDKLTQSGIEKGGRIKELEAHCERLRWCCEMEAKRDHPFDDTVEAAESTPAQSLNLLRAEAIEEMLNSIEMESCFGKRPFIYVTEEAIQEYAKNLRNQP